MPKGPERDLEVINQAPESIQSILRELENVPSSGILAREAALKVSEAVVKSLEERSDFEVWGIIKELGDWIFLLTYKEFLMGFGHIRLCILPVRTIT